MFLYEAVYDLVPNYNQNKTGTIVCYGVTQHKTKYKCTLSEKTWIIYQKIENEKCVLV